VRQVQTVYLEGQPEKESNQIGGVSFVADAMNINHAAHALRFRESHRGIVRRTPPGSGYSPTCVTGQTGLQDRRIAICASSDTEILK
jgi:hypothetical protein